MDLVNEYLPTTGELPLEPTPVHDQVVAEVTAEPEDTTDGEVDQ